MKRLSLALLIGILGCHSNPLPGPIGVIPWIDPAPLGGSEIGNGGDPLRHLLERGRWYAEQLMARLDSSRVPESVRVSYPRVELDWIVEKKAELANQLRVMELLWVNTLPAACQAHTCACTKPGSRKVYLSLDRCPSVVSSHRAAASLLLHEAVHQLGVTSETFADHIPLIATATWMNMGHPESPHWIGLPPFPTPDHPITRPMRPEMAYSDFGDGTFAVWDEEFLHRYDPLTDRWTRRPVVSNPMGWKSPRPRGLVPRDAFWIKEKGVVLVPCPHTRKNLVGKGAGVFLNASTMNWDYISLEGAPSPRTNFSAIRGGDRIFVWGGQDCDSPGHSLADGAVYDPANNRWEPIPGGPAGAPPDRIQSGVDWANGKLLVFGGYSLTEAAPLNDGGIFDPQTNRWTLIKGPNFLSARIRPLVVGTPEGFVVYGGATHANRPSERSGAVYRFADESWSPVEIQATSPGYAALERVAGFWTGTQVGLVTQTGQHFLDVSTRQWQKATFAVGPKIDLYSSVSWTGMELFVWAPFEKEVHVFFP